MVYVYQNNFQHDFSVSIVSSVYTLTYKHSDTKFKSHRMIIEHKIDF